MARSAGRTRPVIKDVAKLAGVSAPTVSRYLNGTVNVTEDKRERIAKAIKELIGASSAMVQEGSVLADKAGTTMGEVVSAIQRVADIVSEISAATGEQSAGVGQVGQAVTQLDQMTQQNAALVEESAAAAASLREQATRLEQVISVFDVGNATRRTPPALTV